MDNVSSFYAFRFQQAEALAQQGDKEKCLDICWDLRLRSDLSLYRRAHVNYLIAKTVDVQEHPDAAKFAQECIDLTDKVLAQGFSNNPEDLKSLAADAHRIMEEINQKVSEIEEKDEDEAAKADDDDWGEPLDLSVEDAMIEEGLQKMYGPPPFNSMTAEQRGPPTIEGMYTAKAKGSDATAYSPGTDTKFEKKLSELSLHNFKGYLPSPPSTDPQFQNTQAKEDTDMN